MTIGRRSVGRGAAISLLVLVAVLGALVLSRSAPARADVPAQPVTAFTAPPCPGSTDDDPTQATGPVPDLLQVFGQRLDDYNAGQVAVLYDAFGDNDTDGYPALCGTRYVAGIGAVSEWMFCTDIFSHVCSGTDAGGNLLDLDGGVIPGLAHRTSNAKLSSEQESLIAFLIHNGHPYSGHGYYDFGASDAAQDVSSAQRISLQVLIWCVTDPANPLSGDPTEVERAQTCADSMGPAEQQRLLSLIPATPQVELGLAGSVSSIAVGSAAHFTLTTNLFDQPITLTDAGVNGTLSVFGGDATLSPGPASGSTLTVTGTDPAVPQTITLSFTGTVAGNVGLDASAQPVSRTQLGWNQSPGVNQRDGIPCQVFSTFDSVSPLVVRDSTSVTFAATSSTPAVLAATGAASGPALPIGVGLTAVGLALLLPMMTRRPVRGPSGRHVR